MRYSRIFGTTKREANSALASYQQLLSRAGFVRYAQDSVFLLHLGRITIDKMISAVVEIFSSDSQGIGRIRDWPEGVWKLVASEVNSHRQLPISVHSESIPSIRLLDILPDEESSGARVADFQSGVKELAEALGVPAKMIEAPYLYPDDAVSSSIAVDLEESSTTWLRCSHCGYEAELHAARPRVEALAPEPIQEVREVATPGCTTIAAVAEYLGVPESRTLKAVFYADRESRIVFAVIRGDLEVDPVKLERAAGRGKLHVATGEELSAAGMVPGYASPVGIPEDVLVIADESVLSGQNFVAGANKPGFHLTGVNAGRDFTPHIWADIAAASAGDPCPKCGAPLETAHGLVVGRFWQHASELAGRKGLLYLDDRGRQAPLRFVSAEFDVMKLMEAVAAFNHDERGLVWPERAAPYRFHLLTIKPKKEEVLSSAEELYESISKMTLYDDRNASPGVKFSDADLIGLPVRVTISPKSLEKGGAEVKSRSESGYGKVVPIESLKGDSFDL